MGEKVLTINDDIANLVSSTMEQLKEISNKHHEEDKVAIYTYFIAIKKMMKEENLL